MFWKRQSTGTTELTAQELKQQLDQGQGVCIVDVRQPDEYAESHIKGSQLIPLDQLAQRLDELPKDRPIVAMCRSGNRSSVATQLLKRAGFDTSNLRGGMLAWEKQKLPVERGA